MRWVLTVHEPSAPRGPQHKHIDIGDPQEAAVIIGEINDQFGKPLQYDLEQFVEEWHCPDCGAWRVEATPAST